MNNMKKYFAILLSAIFIVNLCGCGKDQIKTVKKTSITPITEYKTRVVGQRIVGEEVYSDENENGIIDDFEGDNDLLNNTSDKNNSSGTNESNNISGGDNSSSDNTQDDNSSENNSSNNSELDDTSSDTNSENIAPEKPMTDNFIEEGKLNYRIIRPSSSDDYVTVVTRNFASEIKSKLNCNVEFKTDAISPSKNIRELLIGNSNRPATVYAEKLLRANRSNCYYDSIVCAVGNDICIFAYEKEALVKATEHFINTFCDGNTKKVPTNYSWIYEGNSSHTIYPNLKTFTIGDKDVSEFRIVIPKEYSSYEIGCATYLQYTIGTAVGTPIDIALDSVQSIGNEIHIGPTSRNLTAPSDKSKYIAKYSNGNLYYSSNDEELVYMAIKDLCETIKSTNGAYSIPATYNVDGNYYDLKCSFGNGYNLVWYEEFDEISDSGVTKTDYGLDSKYWNNGKRKVYHDKAKETFDTKTNVKLNGKGQLELIAERVDERNYRAGEITTEGKAFFKYGYIELKMKFAESSGVSNVWWFNSTLSANDRPEIDVFEQFGIEKRIVSNLHSWNVGTEKKHYDHGAKEEAGDWPFNRQFIPEGTELIANNKYRIIGMEWTPETITFYADGLPYCVWDIRDPIYQAFRDYPVYTLIECYSHQSSAQGFGAENAKIQSLDYLRVYQRDSSIGYESFVSNSGAKVKGTDLTMPLPLS